MKKIKITTRASLNRIEKWINKMNDSGWHLIKYCNWIYTFEKGNKNVEYFLHLMVKSEKMDKESIRFEITSLFKGYFINSTSLLIFCIDCSKKKEIINRIKTIKN